MLNLIVRLGFLINVDKSSITPNQSIIYIGALFKVDQGIILPTPERVQWIISAVHSLMNGKITARHYLHLLGKIASCLELIPNAKLFMRPIQLHILENWSPLKMSLEFQIPCTQKLKAHLKWWLSLANITQGRSLILSQQTITVTTDASLTGWRGHIKNQTVQVLWTEQMKLQHINNLEFHAVFLTIKTYQKLLQNKQVLVRTDNTTVGQYINKQGGTHSLLLCQQVWDLWMFALEHNMVLKAAHIAGVKNILADQLSRIKIRATELKLTNVVVQKIFQIWGHPTIDLFATFENKKGVVFCSWIQHPQSLTVDALTINWDNMFAYAYPPLTLIPKVLQHMQKFQCEIIRIAPFWPTQHWYPQLLQLLVAYPLRIPTVENLLTQGKRKVAHPDPDIFKLTAWRLSTNVLKQEVFQKMLRNCCQLPGDYVLRRTINVSSENSIAGVLNRKLIPIQLFRKLCSFLNRFI